jgi:hypothetical protein
MTWADTLATGSGRLRFRLMIEGWPEEFVTDDTITHATNRDGRTVLSGLSYDGMKIGDRCLPWEGKLQADGNSFNHAHLRRADQRHHGHRSGDGVAVHVGGPGGRAGGLRHLERWRCWLP